MPLVRVRILQGTKLLGSPTRPYHGSTTLQSVLEKALAGLSGYTVQSVNAYPSVNEEAARRSDFLPEDFGDVTVDELVSMTLVCFGWRTWRTKMASSRQQEPVVAPQLVALSHRYPTRWTK